ncbi:MAG: acyl-CoA dehydrogenase family protein, partial [Longimicrobiales bacterium]
PRLECGHCCRTERANGFMDFAWSEEQRALRARYAGFAHENLNRDLVARDRDGVFQRENWQACADFGILGLSVPPEYGGAGLDLLTAMLAMEGLGYGCRDNGLTFGLNAQLWTVQLPIARFGTAAQKQRFLPGLCSGEWIGAHAITEAGAGSDVFSLQARAEKRDGGYVLNGTKHLVTFAPVADLALVFATTDPAKGKWGITAFVVERGSAGFRSSPVRDKMGLRTAPIGELIFENCFVPEDNRIGPEGAGVSISTHSLEVERCCILASQLGAMERQLEKAICFARERRQFGQPIGKFQSVANRLADMRLRLETSRLLLYKVAWLKSMDKPAMLEAALLKLHLSESFVESGLDAIRIHGGSGYLTESEIERDLRDAVGGTLYAGTSDIQRIIIARALGL